MKLIFYVAFGSALVFAPDSGVADTKLLAPKRLMYNAQGKLEFFKTKPAKDFMSLEEFQRYTIALSSRDCKAAGRILTNAFFRTYSQFRPAKTRYDCTPAEYINCVDWEFYAQGAFNSYAFCTLNEDLRNLDKKLRQRRKTVPKYTMPRFPKKKDYDNRNVRGRDEVLSSLIAQADGGYAPSLEKIAGLVRRGDVFSVGSDVEYYILRRACILTRRCAKWQVRLDELKNHLGSNRADYIDNVARKPKLKQPRLNDLLLGQPL